jgi:CO/xanthine dehydrogenase FAD-binding subunit
MRIRPFDYWAAPGLDEALNELDLHGADAKVIAGGTDLVLNMKKKISCLAGSSVSTTSMSWTS